jgi:uncharacterized protein YyaL (SSP411 family)
MRFARWGLGLAAAVSAAVLVAPFAARAGKPARPANRLKDETSPYLLQHAHNPVDWYPWGPAAFARAKQEGKPIFLSVGYSSCHWCHVMERESFEDEGIARQLNEHFVCVKVDREERPDVDEIYMLAVQTLNGSGGWPMSVFLLPDGKPFHGGTYYRPADFAELLRAVTEAWRDGAKRAQLEEQGRKLSAAIAALGVQPRPPGELTPAVLGAAPRVYPDSFDAQNGGFGQRPKFPPSSKLLLLLAEHRRKPNPEALRMVTLTLDRMARGGLYDQVGGGFHRYCVDQKWLVPHFEKMLYDNALLARVYFEAAEAVKTAEGDTYRRIGRETLDFALRELRDPKGGFWSALDADSLNAKGEREEGLFYVWKPAQVAEALGEKDAALFNRIFGVTPGGNWEGHSILNLLPRSLDGWARELKTTPTALEARVDAWREKLRAVRAKRPRPHLDDKVLVNWNGLMIQALAVGYDATGDVRYREAAEGAADFILKEMRKEGRLHHSYRAGRTQPQAFLEDYSFLIAGLLELHRVTREEARLAQAADLARRMISDFWDEPASTFYATPHHHEALLARLPSPEDGATPSGLGMATLSLVRLARLTPEPDFRVKSQRLLESYTTEMKRQPHAVPTLILAAHAFFAPQAAPPASAGAQPTNDKPVVVSLQKVPAGLKAGQVFEAEVKIRIAAGWHINSNEPGNADLVATRVEPAAPFKLVSAVYPPGKSLKVSFSDTPVSVFEGEAVVKLKLRADKGVEKARELRVKVAFQPCNDQTCLLPTSLPAVTPLRR